MRWTVFSEKLESYIFECGNLQVGLTEDYSKEEKSGTCREKDN